MDMTSSTRQALGLLLQARHALYQDRILTIRQCDMRARRLNHAIIHLQAVPNPDYQRPAERTCTACGSAKPIGQSCGCFDNDSQ